MTTLDELQVTRVTSTSDKLEIDFDDGRSVNSPLIGYPRLFRATQAQRDRYELMGKGYGGHWPELDEDLSAKSLALGSLPSNLSNGKTTVSGKVLWHDR